MDIGKLKGLSIGDLTERAQALAEKLAPTDPDFASDLALSLVKGVLSGNEDLSDIVGLFGEDADISGGLFPEEPVTVTKTTTSVGGLPPEDLGDTPEEKSMVNDAEQLMNEILSAKDEAEVDAILAKNGIDAGNEPGQAPVDLGDTPEEKDLLDQAVKNSEAPAKEDKPAEKPEEKKEDKPAEEAPAKEDKPTEEKPADKPEEKKSESKSDDDNADTQKNILKGLDNRF